ncbi:hypothetical protein ACSBR1_019749 [Camellia fascicularis]
MSNMMFLSFLVILAATMQETHAVEFSVTNNVPTTPGGIRFTNEIGLDYTKQTLISATNFIWSTFQENTDADRKNVAQVNLFIDSINVPAYTSNNEIHVNANYIQGYSGDVKTEITGVVYHEMTHPGQGDRWDHGYDVTARFLDYCDSLKNGFVAELNKKIRNGYNADYFVQLLGKTVDQLWSD